MREERPIIASIFIFDWCQRFPGALEDENSMSKSALNFQVGHPKSFIIWKVFNTAFDLNHRHSQYIRPSQCLSSAFGINNIPVQAAAGVRWWSSRGSVIRLSWRAPADSTSEEDGAWRLQNIQTAVRELRCQLMLLIKKPVWMVSFVQFKRLKPIAHYRGFDFFGNALGIHRAGSEIGDQKRVMTPQEASSNRQYLYCGKRPIIQAENFLDV